MNKEIINQIYNLANNAQNLPCGGQCTYPNCKDEITSYGKTCMERCISEIKKLCKKI